MGAPYAPRPTIQCWALAKFIPLAQGSPCTHNSTLSNGVEGALILTSQHWTGCYLAHPIGKISSMGRCGGGGRGRRAVGALMLAHGLLCVDRLGNWAHSTQPHLRFKLDARLLPRRRAKKRPMASIQAHPHIHTHTYAHTHTHAHGHRHSACTHTTQTT